MKKVKLAIIDTTFARLDMGAVAIDEIGKKFGKEVEIIRRTVPGMKDIAVEAKRLLDGGADIALACGWVGGAELDAQCGNQASTAIMNAKLMTGKHILEAFVHESEAEGDEKALAVITENRVREHAVNAVQLVARPDALIELAGTGQRQGGPDVGPLKVRKTKEVGSEWSQSDWE